MIYVYQMPMVKSRGKRETLAGPRAQDLIGRRRRLLASLRDSRPLLMGSVYTTYQRCGNPTCHCAQGRGHLKTLLVYRIQGRRVCKLVRKADVSWVREAAERYRGSASCCGNYGLLTAKRSTCSKIWRADGQLNTRDTFTSRTPDVAQLGMPRTPRLYGRIERLQNVSNACLPLTITMRN